MFLTQQILNHFQNRSEAPALQFWEGAHIQVVCFRELRNIAFAVAEKLMSLGLKPGDRTVIYSQNRPEWIFADLGALFAGAVSSAIYSSSAPDEAFYVLKDLEARFLFVENEEQLDKIFPYKDELPFLEKIFVFQDFSGESDWLCSFDLILNNKISNECEETLLVQNRSLGGDEPCAVIYTSGTTGESKGVVLTHQHYLKTILGLKEFFDDFSGLRVNLSFLPYAHALERLSGYYLILYLGQCISLARSYDAVVEDFQVFQPNIAVAVPRFFEKVHDDILTKVKNSSKWKRRLFYWALRVGKRTEALRSEKKAQPWFLRMNRWFADVLVFRRFRSVFGGQLRYFFAGGAPMNPEITRFFFAIGVYVLEGWGATEMTAPGTLNRPDAFRIGTVGKPLPGVELRISEDSELEVRGPTVFCEYFNKPEITLQSFTEDGFYRTGDLGIMDDDGFVSITGRKNELITTAFGKVVAPSRVRAFLLQQPHISNAYIYGDKQEYLSALLVLDEENTRASAERLSLLEMPDWEDVIQQGEVQHLICTEVDAANRRLASFEQIKYFSILKEPFSVKRGEMTSSRKLKSNVIELKYKALLEQMY